MFSDTFAGIALASAVPFIVAQLLGGLLGLPPCGCIPLRRRAPPRDGQPVIAMAVVKPVKAAPSPAITLTTTLRVA